MANQKLLFVNAECEYEETMLSVTMSTGVADAGAFVTLGADGVFDPSVIPAPAFDPINCPNLTAVTVQGALDELCAAVDNNGAIAFTVGAGGVTMGTPVCIEGDNTVVATDITTPCRVIGIAGTTEAAAGTVSVIPNDALVAGVLTGAMAGDVIYYDGTALTTTKPTAPGTRVWQIGVAANATDLYTDIRFVKVNS